jgi:PAS domain S-box-containing protein
MFVFTAIGSVICFLMLRLIADINSDLNNKNEQLKVQKKILDRSQEIANLGSWHLDIKKNILTWSDEQYRIFGRTPQEFGATYEAFLDTIHPDDREMVDKTYTNAINNKLLYECVHRIIRNDGEERVVLEKSEDIVDEKGNTIHSFGFTQDITEQKLAEQEREKIIENLQKSLDEIKTLRGILPICSFCKNIRNDDGYYEQIEAYIHKHSGVDFSHTICPKCMEKYYPEEYKRMVLKKKD